jgi:hypothetical protein
LNRPITILELISMNEDRTVVWECSKCHARNTTDTNWAPHFQAVKDGVPRGIGFVVTCRSCGHVGGVEPYARDQAASGAAAPA